MISFIKNNLTFTEAILIFAGVLFFLSTVYIALGGDLSLNYVAKIAYIIGTILLVFKT